MLPVTSTTQGAPPTAAMTNSATASWNRSLLGGFSDPGPASTPSGLLCLAELPLKTLLSLLLLFERLDLRMRMLVGRVVSVCFMIAVGKSGASGFTAWSTTQHAESVSRTNRLMRECS